MSTRALYSFIDQNNIYHVYKHHDGCPRGAYEWIKKSLGYAWELPRFEANDFAAAFVAANKGEHGGGVYLTYGHHGDLSYRYEISQSSYGDEDTLYIKAFEMNEDKLIFEGSLGEFYAFTFQEVNYDNARNMPSY